MEVVPKTCLVPPGEFRIARGNGSVLETHLGSCVGVSLFDRYAQTGGLIHIILPQGRKEKEVIFPAKYANSGIPFLLAEMVRHGARKEHMVAEIAGGALMLPSQRLSVDMNIGRRNTDKAEEILAREGIRVLRRAVGGYQGRAFSLNPADGKTAVRYTGEKSFGGSLPESSETMGLDEVTKGIEYLKPVPEKARRIISSMEFSSRHSPFDLENYALRDQAICANVLKMLNDTRFGSRGKVASISHAGSHLGIDVLKELVLAGSRYGLYENMPDCYSTKEGNLSRHSICCAMATEFIAREKGLGDPTLFFTAGLLHDIGKTILDQYSFSSFNLVMDRVINEGKTFVEAENKILGFDHVQIGGIAAMEWGFPQVLVEAISFHHEPEKALDNVEVVSTVHIADILCSMFGAGAGLSAPVGAPRRTALTVLDLRPKDVEAILDQLPDIIKEAL